MDLSYSPYQNKKKDKKKFHIPKFNIKNKFKIIIVGIISIIILIIFIAYSSLGELKFFAKHILSLGFFNKNYLVLLQNNYELRPDGGFITSFAELNVKMGRIKSIDIKNSYEIDTKSYMTPPYPQEELLKNESYKGYTFRDSNWDPDFIKAKDDILKFYNTKYPKKKIDGIIVVNFSAIEDILESFGELKIDKKILNKNNLFSELEFSVNNIDRHNIKDLENRKNILSDLANSLASKIKKHPYKVKDSLIKSLNNKNIFLWIKNKRIENDLIEKKWANTMPKKINGDFFAINLANLGSKKSDRYIQKEVYYYANLKNEIPQITNEIVIRNTGEKNSYSDDYKGYLRIYIPKNYKLIESPIDSKVENIGEYKIISNIIIIPAGSKTTLSYRYTGSRNTIRNNEYNLDITKQSGENTLYNLYVESSENNLLKSEDFETKENKAFFSDRLTNDKNFKISLSKSNLPAYPIFQEFTDLNNVKIIWNKEINSSNLNANNFIVKDKDIKNNKITDKIKVVYTELTNPNEINLELEGVSKQNLEQYEITLKDIKDLNGNLIYPNPKKITVVQKIKKEE